MVKVICYNRSELWHSRKRAYQFYWQGVMACEGSERDRYINICNDLQAKKKVCTDGFSIPCRVYDNTPDGSRDFGGKINY